MFAQVIRAEVLDAQAVENQFRRWVTEVASGTSRWRDVTGGVTGDWNLIAVARLESAEHVRTSSGHQEQDAWWKETALFRATSTLSTRAET